MNNQIKEEKQEKNKEIIEVEKTNIRGLKKQQLILLNHHFGFVIKKKVKRNVLLENLLKIQRKMIISKNVLLEKEDCPICFIPLNKWNNIITTCGHAYCNECIFKYITMEKEICPICREPYTYDEFIKPFTIKEIEALLSVIHKNKEPEIDTIVRTHSSGNYSLWYSRIKKTALYIVYIKIYWSLFCFFVGLLQTLTYKGSVFIIENHTDVLCSMQGRLYICYDYMLSEI